MNREHKIAKLKEGERHTTQRVEQEIKSCARRNLLQAGWGTAGYDLEIGFSRSELGLDKLIVKSDLREPSELALNESKRTVLCSEAA